MGISRHRILAALAPLAIPAAIVAALALNGCTDEASARRAIAASGLTEVRTNGYAWFGCGDGDAFHTGFTARGADGSCVEGVVCSGWLKGATVRITGGSKACPVLGPAAPQSAGR